MVGRALSAEAPLPQYAEQVYAGALLYMRHPEEAREAYRRVLLRSPKDEAARYGLFYASVELEDWTTAYATIDALVADEPLWRVYRGDPTPQPNHDAANAQVTAAQARFYGNQLGDAWARIVKISDAAPADSNARIALYSDRQRARMAEAGDGRRRDVPPTSHRTGPRRQDRPRRNGDRQLSAPSTPSAS